MKREPGVGWLALAGALAEGRQWFVHGQGRALVEAVARFRPVLEQEAMALARGDKKAAMRLVRAAMDRLWEWDVGRFGERDAEYLLQALLAAMRLAQTLRGGQRRG